METLVKIGTRSEHLPESELGVKSTYSQTQEHIRALLEQEFRNIIEREGTLSVDEIISLRVLLSSVFTREELTPVLAELVAKSFELDGLDTRTMELAVP